MSVYNTKFCCILALDDGMVDRGTYVRQQCSSSSSLFSRFHQSQDDQIDEILRRHEEWMQYIISMVYVNIFKYAFF
jgi:hypothetical protein